MYVHHSLFFFGRKNVCSISCVFDFFSPSCQLPRFTQPTRLPSPPFRALFLPHQNIKVLPPISILSPFSTPPQLIKLSSLPLSSSIPPPSKSSNLDNRHLSSFEVQLMEQSTNSKERMTLPQRPPTLAVHENSHAITKLKPEIRIVHIFAPEIIKTDPANFRELVQRLTGKPTKRTATKKKTLPMTIDGEALPRCKRFEVAGSQQKHEDSGCRDGVERELQEEEDEEEVVEKELWVENSTGAFFRYLGETDGFLQGLSDLPLLPLSPSQMDMSGEATVP